jgi:hypothetical protein
MAVVLGDEIERVADTYVSFSKDSEIEAGAAAAQEPLDHIRPIEADTKLETRHPWLRHDEFCGPSAKSVSDVNSVFQQAFRGQVLSECSPWKVRAGKFVAPERVVLRRVSINRLIGPTVNGEIRLPVTQNVQSRNLNATRNRCLEYGRQNAFTSPLDFAWETRVN